MPETAGNYIGSAFPGRVLLFVGLDPLIGIDLSLSFLAPSFIHLQIFCLLSWSNAITQEELYWSCKTLRNSSINQHCKL